MPYRLGQSPRVAPKKHFLGLRPTKFLLYFRIAFKFLASNPTRRPFTSHPMTNIYRVYIVLAIQYMGKKSSGFSLRVPRVALIFSYRRNITTVHGVRFRYHWQGNKKRGQKNRFQVTPQLIGGGEKEFGSCQWFLSFIIVKFKNSWEKRLSKAFPSR